MDVDGETRWTLWYLNEMGSLADKGSVGAEEIWSRVETLGSEIGGILVALLKV